MKQEGKGQGREGKEKKERDVREGKEYRGGGKAGRGREWEGNVAPRSFLKVGAHGFTPFLIIGWGFSRSADRMPLFPVGPNSVGM